MITASRVKSVRKHEMTCHLQAVAVRRLYLVSRQCRRLTLEASVETAATFPTRSQCPSRQQMAAALIVSRKISIPWRIRPIPSICGRATFRAWGAPGLLEIASSRNSYSTSQTIKVRGHCSRIFSCMITRYQADQFSWHREWPYTYTVTYHCILYVIFL